MTGRLRTRALPVFPVTAQPVRPGVVPAELTAATPVRGEAGPEDGPRIGLVTLGCDKNTVDSERMMAALAHSGGRVAAGAEGAEILVINTCGFIDAAKEESIETILEACERKAEGGVRAVVAVGCLVQRYRDELAREIPEVDLFLGISEMPGMIPELRRRGLLPRKPSRPNMEIPLRILASETPHTAHLKISEGCDHSCAFCAIPHMRGLHRSAPLEELVREAVQLEAAGVRELNLISQDTTWYGKDLRREAMRQAGPGGNPEASPLLPDLLRGLLRETTIPWFRLFYMYPSGITPELVELMASEPRLLPYLDMPIQHGSDEVLRAMRRPERQETIRRRVRELRAAVPDLVLRTTVIVGFPGETEEAFGEMLDLLRELRFERVGAFPYSIEDGTLAATMKDQVPDDEKAERLESLLEFQRAISFEANESRIGRVERVLVDRSVEGDPDFVGEGRTAGQAAEVDGLTRLVGERAPGPGAFIEVEIVDAEEYDLVGRVIDAG